MSLHYLFVLGGMVTLAASPVPGDTAIQDGAFRKEGLEALNAPHYQYEILGLGGTTMRVGPHGFTYPGAPGVDSEGYLEHLPYLAYQYWWDAEGHRHLPFGVVGGYGDSVDPGAIRSFRHKLDIETGVLDIRLQLETEAAGSFFESRREMFITPDGVWVVRVTDSPEAPHPFRLRIEPNQNVRIYLNIGIYDKPHAPWSGTATARDEGLLVEATRPDSCVATLAVAVDAPEVGVDPAATTVGSARSGQTLTFYVAPGSSYEGADPAAAAWRKVDEARARGFDALRAETAAWWKAFYGRSKVDLPDADLAKWYARSMYYHGVYFGNTDIPPGCFGTSIEGFAGAVCTEYDLVLDQMALLYTGHFAESGRTAAWLARVLPRAERYTAEGIAMHNTSLEYSGGAKYSTLMGYDGTLCVQPGETEGVNIFSNYPGANAAFMALAHFDWTLDPAHEDPALRILKQTTRVSLHDLDWRDDFDAWVNRNAPSTVQQAATAFGLSESRARGVADPDWDKYADTILLPTDELDGRPVLVGGAGGKAVRGKGDSTWMIPLWWYRIIPVDDPRVRPTYEMVRESRTGDYVFNNGWVGVIAAKLGEGEEALRWIRGFLRPDVTVFDDTCFGEIVYGEEDFKKAPEIAAHSAFICNAVHMLMDGDSSEVLTVFPALPGEWRRSGVAFDGLRARGGLAVSGTYGPARASVTVRNLSDTPARRTLRIRLYDEKASSDDARMEQDYAVVDLSLSPGETADFDFPARRDAAEGK